MPPSAGPFERGAHLTRHRVAQIGNPRSLGRPFLILRATATRNGLQPCADLDQSRNPRCAGCGPAGHRGFSISGSTFKFDFRSCADGLMLGARRRPFFAIIFLRDLPVLSRKAVARVRLSCESSRSLEDGSPISIQLLDVGQKQRISVARVERTGWRIPMRPRRFAASVT